MAGTVPCLEINCSLTGDSSHPILHVHAIPKGEGEDGIMEGGGKKSMSQYKHNLGTWKTSIMHTGPLPITGGWHLLIGGLLAILCEWHSLRDSHLFTLNPIWHTKTKMLRIPLFIEKYKNVPYFKRGALTFCIYSTHLTGIWWSALGTVLCIIGTWQKNTSEKLS